MKRFVGLFLLLISVGIFGGCGSQSNQIDKNAQKSEKVMLSFINKLSKKNREEEHGSSFKEVLSEKNVKKVYYSGSDFNEYLFVVQEQLYKDSELKKKDYIYTAHYKEKDGDVDVVSDKEFEKMIKDESNHFDKIYESE